MYKYGFLQPVSVQYYLHHRYNMNKVVLETDLPLPKKKGKVRDVYDLGDHLLFVSTDRISAFDSVLPVGIPRKGEILNTLSAYWFKELDVASHFVTANYEEMLEYDKDKVIANNKDLLDKRSMIVKKFKPVPVECVVRGYLAGSAWKEYCKTGQICGIKLPPGLKENFPLPEPIFTPTTKAETGHDQNITFEQMVELLGDEQLAEDLQDASIYVYEQAVPKAFANGIIIADTKLEWGLYWETSPVLIDEVLTPDSSRFWAVDRYRLDFPIDSFDKQYVRNYLTDMQNCGSDNDVLPQEVIEMTTKKYLEAYKALTGQSL